MVLGSFNGIMDLDLVETENFVVSQHEARDIVQVERNVLNAFGSWQHEVRSFSTTQRVACTSFLP